MGSVPECGNAPVPACSRGWRSRAARRQFPKQQTPVCGQPGSEDELISSRAQNSAGARTRVTDRQGLPKVWVWRLARRYGGGGHGLGSFRSALRIKPTVPGWRSVHLKRKGSIIPKLIKLPLRKPGRAELNQSQISLCLCFVQEIDSGWSHYPGFFHRGLQFGRMGEFLSIFQRIPLINGGYTCWGRLRRGRPDM